MNYRELDGGREFVARLDHGGDWRGQIESFAADEGVSAAFFVGLGAVQDAEFYFYDQADKEYYPEVFDEPLEVAACVGNISMLDSEESRSSGNRTQSDDGEPFAHTHAVCSREDGTALAGHLNAGTVFAGELYVREFDAELHREHDATTDLDLWPL